MKRYNSVYDGVYTKPNEMVEEANGDWVRWEDVQRLEARNKALLEALEWIAKQYDDSKPIVHCASDAYAMSAWAGVAIARAKGEQP